MTSPAPLRHSQVIHEAEEISAASDEARGQTGGDSDCREMTRFDSSGLAGPGDPANAPQGELRCNVSAGALGSACDTQPTRTQETTDSYRARWPSLLRLATGQSEHHAPTAERIGAVAQWLAEARDRYRPNSYRQYRAVLFWVVDQTPGLAPAQRQEIEALVRAAEETEGRKRRGSLPVRTSAGKRRRIDEADFEKLRHDLEASSIPSDTELLTFLAANTLVGLRPREWAGASLSTDALGQAVLRVANGKNTNGRANGPARTLTFSVQDSAMAMAPLASCLKLVDRILADVRADDRQQVWSLYCRSLQDRFRVVNHRLWPKRKRHYSLYSTRHTLLAAAKTKFAPPEVAALAGHASDATATQHYARPRRGGGQAPKILPAPAEAEVESVRKKLKADWLESVITAKETTSARPR